MLRKFGIFTTTTTSTTTNKNPKCNTNMQGEIMAFLCSRSHLGKSCKFIENRQTCTQKGPKMSSTWGPRETQNVFFSKRGPEKEKVTPKIAITQIPHPFFTFFLEKCDPLDPPMGSQNSSKIDKHHVKNRFFVDGPLGSLFHRFLMKNIGKTQWK